MPAAAFSLPVLHRIGPWRLTPTDVTQFVRQEQCKRFLRFRLAERAAHDYVVSISNGTTFIFKCPKCGNRGVDPLA